MPSVSVCMTPALIHLFDLKGKVAVVTDVLRATSAMVTGLQHGVEHIRPISKLDDTKVWADQGYVIAGEREGKVVDGFEFGNSPFSYMTDRVIGKKIALTTTNGTRAINLSLDADVVIASALINVTATVEKLQELGKDVVIVCAGWKDQFNLEDTLFAGAAVNRLWGLGWEIGDDAGMAAQYLYRHAFGNLFGFLKNSSHYHRLIHLGIEKDIKYCLQEDITNVVAILNDGVLVKA